MATVLIVDDDAGLREGLAEALTDLGHRTVPDGHIALETAVQERFDAAVRANKTHPGKVWGASRLTAAAFLFLAFWIALPDTGERSKAIATIDEPRGPNVLALGRPCATAE
jgi:hypothetical protein